MPEDLKDAFSLTQHESKDFDLVEASFGEDIDGEIKNWLHESIRVYQDSHDNLFKSKVTEWRRICKGDPREKDKAFPWPNCSNLIVQIAGQRVDDLTARVIQIIWATSPAAVFRYPAKTDDPKRTSEKRRTLEQFIDIVSYELDELDLYNREMIGFADCARLGFTAFKVIPEHRVNIKCVEGAEGTKRKKLEGELAYDGPKVENLEYEDVLCDDRAPSWEKSRLKIHIRRGLSKAELQERAFAGYYDEKAVKEIIDKPDRHGPDEAKRRQQQKRGVQMDEGSKVLAEWDIHECWFWWWISVKGDDGKMEQVKVDLLWSYHFKTKTVMRKLFNFMPDNACPMITAKLNIADKGVRGIGLAEMLSNAQEEVSTQHNQRIDARTMAITGIIRSGNYNLDKNIKIYPFCILPGEKDEIEMLKNPMDIGDGGIQDEEMAIRLADERAGVGPSIQGMGTGSVNKKGQYGSQGVLATMTEGNSRTNNRTSDFRHAHVKIVSLCTAMYGKMGTGRRGSMFGLNEDLLKEALDDYANHRVRIPIRAATASVNKEVEKQNLMLLKTTLMQHDANKIKMIQAIVSGQTIPPFAKKAMIAAVNAQDNMMRQVIRDFAISDQPDEFVAEVEFPDDAQAQARPAPAPGPVGLAQPQQQPGGVPGNGAGGGLAAPLVGPQGQPGGGAPPTLPQ